MYICTPAWVCACCGVLYVVMWLFYLVYTQRARVLTEFCAVRADIWWPWLSVCVYNIYTLHYWHVYKYAGLWSAQTHTTPSRRTLLQFRTVMVKRVWIVGCVLCFFRVQCTNVLRTSQTKTARTRNQGKHARPILAESRNTPDRLELIKYRAQTGRTRTRTKSYIVLLILSDYTASWCRELSQGDMRTNFYIIWLKLISTKVCAMRLIRERVLWSVPVTLFIFS